MHTCRSARVIAVELIGISRVTGSLCAQRRAYTLVRLAAARCRIRSTLGLDPVANVINPPSSHAEKQLDRRGEGSDCDMAPQRRFGDGNQGQDLRHAHEAGQRAVRGHDVDGTGGIERGELKHPEIFSAWSPLADVSTLSPMRHIRLFARRALAGLILVKPCAKILVLRSMPPVQAPWLRSRLPPRSPSGTASRSAVPAGAPGSRCADRRCPPRP